VKKEKMIIFEGISGSGKTTLFHPTHKLSNYRDVMLHRFTPTHWVQDKVNRRRVHDYEELNAGLQSIAEVFVIWCDVAPDIAMKRQIAKKDPMIEDLRIARTLFYEYFTEVTSFKNILHVNTGTKDLETCVEEIKEFVYGKDW